jgi:hypothetical protein
VDSFIVTLGQIAGRSFAFGKETKGRKEGRKAERCRKQRKGRRTYIFGIGLASSAPSTLRADSVDYKTDYINAMFIFIV